MLANHHDTTRSWITDLLLLCVLIGSAFAFMLGSRPLNVPDEARYSEIPREMLATHNFVTPHINGIKYFEKPPLFYWMQAGALKTFGLNEWAARAVDALIALFGCLATYIAARQLFNRRTALFAAAITASSLLYFALARIVTLDMTVSVLITLSLYSFITSVELPPGFLRRCGFYLFYIFAALSLLAKGLIGILFPGCIIFVWLFFTQRWHELKHCYIFTGLGLFLIIGLPWHLLAQQANPEFFYFYFIDQQFIRYLTMESGRYQPMWFYIPILLLGLFPWTGLVVPALARLKRQYQLDSFFLIWAAFIFIFFSISKSKLIPYILPCIPPLAILIARYLAELKNQEKNNALLCSLVLVMLICLGLIIGIPLYLSTKITTDYNTAVHYSHWVITALTINFIFVPLLYWRRGFLAAFIGQVICSGLFLFSLCATLPYIYMDSIKPLALQLKPQLQPTDMVATYDYYYQDLPFYLQRNVTIINWQSELAFGLQHQNSMNLWMDDADFWHAWQSQQRIYMMLATNLFHNLQQKLPYQFYVVAEGKNDLIVTNHKRTAL